VQTAANLKSLTIIIAAFREIGEEKNAT
jgi:hypothetical protein